MLIHCHIVFHKLTTVIPLKEKPSEGGGAPHQEELLFPNPPWVQAGTLLSCVRRVGFSDDALWSGQCPSFKWTLPRSTELADQPGLSHKKEQIPLPGGLPQGSPHQLGQQMDG